MDEMTSLLEREARRVTAQPDALEATMVRGRRRARRARVLTIALALGIAAGSFTGLLHAFGGGSSAQPVAGGWAGTWPQATLQGAQAAQARADSGDAAYLWQLDGKVVLSRYGHDQLKWKGFEFLSITVGKGLNAPGYNNEPDLSNPDASGPFRFMIIGCDASVPGVTCPTATVTIQRLLRQDRTGLWSVIKVEDRGTATGAYPSPAGG